MRIFITGVTGFVGSQLAAHLSASGHEVLGSSSGRPKMQVGNVVALPLGDPVNPALFEDVDVIVHAAHDMTRGARARNVSGTLLTAGAAKLAGVDRQIYVSSYSAHPGAVTEYALTKLELEEWFLANQHPVVRPGLVIGNGGLYARIVQTFKRTYVMPVICPDALLPLIGVKDLTTAIGAMLGQTREGLVRLYLRDRVTMWELMAAIRSRIGSRVHLVPFPSGIALPAASILDLIGVRTPLTRDAVRALRMNQSVTGDSELAQLVPSPSSIREMIDAAH